MKLLNKIALTAFLFISIITITYGQDLNDYKYILVPEKFEEMKVADQYRLNGLTNFLFNENGNRVCYKKTINTINETSKIIYRTQRIKK